MNLRPLALLAGAVILSACGFEAGIAPPANGLTAGQLTIVDAPADGPAVTVTDALSVSSDSPIGVSGALFVTADGTAYLCSAIAESFPPQCGGDRLEVEGLDVSSVELQAAGDVRWAESVELVGSVGR